MRNNKGQGTLELILLVTAVTAFMVVFTVGSGSIFQKKMTNSVSTTMTGMEDMAAKLTNSIASN